MKIIFVDRNVIIKIRQKLNMQVIDKHHAKALRTLDRKNNFISPLLAIIEGQKGRREDIDEIKNTVNTDTKLISKFFKKANTDSEFLLNTINEFAEIFGNNIELDWNLYKKFLLEINDFLYQPISRIKQKKYQNIILDTALKYTINIGHPIVVCCLSILYGNDDSRQILKFKQNMNDNEKEKNIYNALNDLMVISRIARINVLLKQSNKKFNVEYFTFDKYLKIFLNSIKVDGKKFIDESTEITATEIEITYQKDLFPNLDEKAYINFTNELKYYKN